MIHRIWNSIKDTVLELVAEGRGKSTRRKSERRGASAALRMLERRQLLSVNPIVYDASTSAVLIHGTSDADTVSVWTDTANIVHVTVQNPTGNFASTFQRSSVTQIGLVAATETIDFKCFSNIPVWASGDGGNDTLIGGTAYNHIVRRDWRRCADRQSISR